MAAAACKHDTEIAVLRRRVGLGETGILLRVTPCVSGVWARRSRNEQRQREEMVLRASLTAGHAITPRIFDPAIPINVVLILVLSPVLGG